MIVIVFKDGNIVRYKADDYTEYKYDNKFFVVIYDEQWIGLYNMDCVQCIEVERCQK